jgi:1-acyl-sn-glycerol-3-phosphate acyltransferase
MLRWLIPLAALVWAVLITSLAVLHSLLTLGLQRHKLMPLYAGIWGGGLLRIFGIKVRVIGAENIPQDRSSIFVANHSSIIDLYAIGSLRLPGMTGLVKHEFLYIPFLNAAMVALGLVFVKRGSREAAKKSIEKLKVQVAKHPRTVLIFPEGTRSPNGELQRFKMGAFHMAHQTGLAIVPAVIHGAALLNPKGTLWAQPGEVTIQVHPPRETTSWDPTALRAVANSLHDEYQLWLDQGPTGPGTDPA